MESKQPCRRIGERKRNMERVQLEVRATLEEIKTKTPRITQISRICEKFSIRYWRRRLDTMEAGMLYEEPSRQAF